MGKKKKQNRKQQSPKTSPSYGDTMREKLKKRLEDLTGTITKIVPFKKILP